MVVEHHHGATSGDGLIDDPCTEQFECRLDHAVLRERVGHVRVDAAELDTESALATEVDADVADDHWHRGGDHAAGRRHHDLESLLTPDRKIHLSQNASAERGEVDDERGPVGEGAGKRRGDTGRAACLRPTGEDAQGIEAPAERPQCADEHRRRLVHRHRRERVGDPVAHSAHPDHHADRGDGTRRGHAVVQSERTPQHVLGRVGTSVDGSESSP